jgi:hypothetical protein
VQPYLSIQVGWGINGYGKEIKYMKITAVYHCVSVKRKYLLKTALVLLSFWLVWHI